MGNKTGGWSGKEGLLARKCELKKDSKVEGDTEEWVQPWDLGSNPTSFWLLTLASNFFLHFKLLQEQYQSIWVAVVTTKGTPGL